MFQYIDSSDASESLRSACVGSMLSHQGCVCEAAGGSSSISSATPPADAAQRPRSTGRPCSPIRPEGASLGDLASSRYLISVALCRLSSLDTPPPPKSLG